MHQSRMRPLSELRTCLQAQNAQWYVRFVARGSTGQSVQNIDLLATTKRMAELRVAQEITLPRGVGSLALFADETVRGSTFLVGVFLPTPPPRGRRERPALPASAHGNERHYDGWSVPNLPISAFREKPGQVWEGFLTVRGNSKVLCIEASATRVGVPDRRPLSNLGRLARNLACTSRDIKPVTRTKVINDNPRAQWCVKDHGIQTKA
eukprot:IDg17335t1